MDRKPYGNHAGNSGVRFYALRSSSIRIWFTDGGSYEYDHRRPGRAHIEAMKRLAAEGRGLATDINRHVRENYARKF